MNTPRTSADITSSQRSSPSTSARAASPAASISNPFESPRSSRGGRWFRSGKPTSPLTQSPLVRAVTMDHFKASSSSCPELNRAGKNGMDSARHHDMARRRPSTSQPVTPPRSTRIRNRLRWSRRTSPATGSPSPRVLTPPTFRESSERRRRARDSSVGEGPSGEAGCHGKARPEEGDMLELAVAGAMIAVLELDRLSGMARGVGEVKQRQGHGGSEE